MKFLHQIISARILSGILLAAFVIPSAPAQAFNCAEASTDVELAICASRELKDADDAMGRAYFNMKNTFAKEPAAVLKNSQRNWLKYRNSYCQAEPACLLDETRSRFTRLDVISRYQPAMVPVFIWQEGGKNAYTMTIDGVKFAYPQTKGQSAFNREFARIIAEAPLGEKTEDQSIGPWQHDSVLRITQLTSRMISATAATYNYSGGAHPNSWTMSINIDLQTGQNIKTTDLFSQASINLLISDCRNMIVNAKAEKFGGDADEARRDIEELYPGEVIKHVLDMTKWNFHEEGATITFNAYAIGAYAEGGYSCDFSTMYIMSLAKDPGMLVR